MRKYLGLTEKRMANRRFRKTEDAILKVFFEETYFTCMVKIAKKVGVARSTIYSHHRAVKEILPDYEKYVMKKYEKMLRGLLKNKNVGLRMVYFRLLIFILQEKKIFLMLIKNNRSVLISRMILKFEPKILAYAKLPKNSEKIFAVYVGEVMSLIGKWMQEGFPEKGIDEVLNDIMFLTDTIRVRMRGLSRYD